MQVLVWCKDVPTLVHAHFLGLETKSMLFLALGCQRSHRKRRA